MSPAQGAAAHPAPPRTHPVPIPEEPRMLGQLFSPRVELRAAIAAGALLGLGYIAHTWLQLPYSEGLIWASLAIGMVYGGRAALEALHAQEARRKLTCIRLTERGVPRSGMAILDASGATVSTLTSGTFSPTLRAGIGMASLPVAFATVGTPMQVQVRDRATAAEVVRRPFYRRPRA